MPLSPSSQIDLSTCKWQWREETDAKTDLCGWHECVNFPTVIHHELEEAKLIPDPFFADNERHIQWIGWKDWAFRTTFATPQNACPYGHAYLALDGLDTVAKVLLNGKLILECDNMFVPYRVEVRDILKQDGKENELYIIFESNARVAKDREKMYGMEYDTYSHLRDSGRLWIRKAQYHWGWDWGPEEVTAGPYKNIRVELFDARIADVHISTYLSDDQKHATIRADIEFEGEMTSEDLVISISDFHGNAVASLRKQISPGKYVMGAVFEIDDPMLWWPAGQGEQPLYTASASLMQKDTIVDEQSAVFGIREIKLIRRPLESEPGETFFFEINKRPTYICGTNWVPAHNQTPKISNDRYYKWIDWAKRNNNNMIRLWGGGYFEHDAFYEACDRAGILIWHDFMTACGVYPTAPFFLKSVEEEVRAQVKRLRNHASIAIWCGNNEDFMIADGRSIKYDIGDLKGPWDKTEMPQRVIYMKIWPEIVLELMPQTAYWPSSPFGGSTANDPTIGDVHQWNVWHAKQLPYQQFPQLGGRFVSEFGMHAFPDMRTVKVFAADKRALYPNSKMMDCHNKSRGAENKMGRYLWENFRMPTSMEAFIFLSQLLQAEALDHSIIHWRRRWKGPGHESNAGSLIWQLQDSNPTTSWSLVDYYFRPKPAFFTSRRAFAPVSVGIARTPVWHFMDEDNPLKTEVPFFEIWGSNFRQEAKRVSMRVRMYDVTHRREIQLSDVTETVYTLKPNSSTELTAFKAPEVVTEDSYVILSATLHELESGSEICRKVSWPEPYRYLDLPDDCDVDVSVKEEQVNIVCGKIPVKGLVVYVHHEDGEDAEWEDNMWDLMPGDEVRVLAKGLAGRKVHARHLADNP